MSEVTRQPVSARHPQVDGTLCLPASIDPLAPLLVCIHGSGCNGRYFDLASNSFVVAATTRGMPVVMLDRPGHGTSGPPAPGLAITGGAEAVGHLLRAVHALHPELAARPIALVGHSFGGAVALTFAARAADVTIAAVCVSGIGDEPNLDYAARDGSERARPPGPYWLFGPGHTYDWRGITALRSAADAWRAEEVHEITSQWPAQWRNVVSAISCPVHFRLAEFERIWDASPQAVERVAAAFGAVLIDAAIAPDGGHLYEVHLRGPELTAAQLDFIGQAVAERG